MPKPNATLTDAIEQPPKSLADHLEDMRECIKTVAPLVPTTKLTLRRETMLMLCESILDLARCATGQHEPLGCLRIYADDLAGLSLQFETEDGPDAIALHVCKRCRAVFAVDESG